MAAGIYNFAIEQGTTFTRTFKYKDSNGDALNLSSHAIRMQLRTSINSTTTIISLLLHSAYRRLQPPPLLPNSSNNDVN